MTGEVEQPETQTETQTEAQTEAQDSSGFRKGYDSIANKDRQPEEAPTETSTEEPPPEPALSGEQARELLAQVARIPDLEKRLRDEGGRYGSLKQQIEQMQQRFNTATTAKEVEAHAADSADLLNDLRDEFPELADKLKGVFDRVLSAKGGQASPDIEQMVAARLAAEKQAALDEAIQQLSNDHPDWMEVRQTPEFGEWKETLSARERVRFDKSQDPFYVAEMLDRHKDWLSSRAKPTDSTAAQANKTRLQNAVLPTNGTKPPQKGEPSPSERFRAGYNKVAGARL